LATLAGKTLTDMAGNGNFPDPVPTLEDYGNHVNDYRTKHEAAAETGGKFATTAKDIARLALLQKMKQLASYVNFTADGDANRLVSSGFMLVPPPKSNTVPEVPLWVRLRRGPQQGQLVMDCAKVRHAWQYGYQLGIRPTDGGPVGWEDAIHSTTRSRTNVIAGLESVKAYWVRVRAMNGYGTGDWSEPVSGSTE
ncbi:fibronectin type III domain-containing protein, partial [Parapedobacter tibetensis]